jgi:hypothetical protein
LYQVSQDVSLPEFFVVGYRQRRVLFPLSSGNYSRDQLLYKFKMAASLFPVAVTPNLSKFKAEHLTVSSVHYLVFKKCGCFL